MGSPADHLIRIRQGVPPDVRSIRNGTSEDAELVLVSKRIEDAELTEAAGPRS